MGQPVGQPEFGVWEPMDKASASGGPGFERDMEHLVAVDRPLLEWECSENSPT